ncbi:MAG: carbohydrate-binding family 9-like protein, partial [Gemmatimonadetes bacterium]|nr:carbohydrate-binding family 9-like protein [Gemmatimonadota bacterium]
MPHRIGSTTISCHRGRLALIAVLALTFTGSASSQDIIAEATTSAITIDGRLDETTWQDAPFTTGLRAIDLGEELAAQQTRFAFRLDDEFLYLAVRAEEPEPDHLQTKATVRDGKVWQDDCIELMIDPSGQQVEYFHLVASASATVYDAWMRQGGHVRSVEWDADLQAATHIGQDHWSLEMAIPLIAIGPFAGSGEAWVFNLSRSRRAGGKQQLSTFAALSGSFHQPTEYVPLQAQGVDLSAYRWQLSPPRDLRLLPSNDGELDDELAALARVTVTNLTGLRGAGRVRLHVGDQPGPWQPMTLASGDSTALDLVAPALPGDHTATVELESGGSTRALMRRQVSLDYRPLSLRILEPSYRDALYPTQHLDDLVVEARSDLSQEELVGLTLSIQLQSPSGEKLVALDALASSVDTLRLKLPALEPGHYPVYARFGRRYPATDDLVAAAHETLRVVAPAAHEWRLARGRLLHNGDAVVPFGWFSIPPEHMAEPGQAFRQMQAYSSQYQSVEEVRAYLDRVHAAGTQVTIYPYPDNSFMSPASVWSRPLTDAQRTSLRERIRALKDHPGLFAWYIADEPELRPTDPRRTDEIYRIISDEDPHHPCIMLNDTVAGISRYAGGGDVLMPDPYPTFLADARAAQPIQKVGAFMDAAVEASEGWRAVWITPQGFNYGDYGRANNRVPSFTELRNMTWQAIAHGARGFLWYTYSQVPNYASLRLGMPWLSYEVDALRAAILSDDAQIDISITADAPHHLHLRARRLEDGQLLLIAVNTDTTAQDVALTLCPALAADSLHVVGENRSVGLVDGGVLRDRFEPYATHLYTTAHVLTDRPDILATQAAIDSADAARYKPGNIAFETT